ncbi:MAG: MoaD/ThiS family protein [Candidatus Bathyarchaeia archaeon]|nr:MoaD/ThiS family protein [Candidatus Bathyarchaeota archaeon]
MIKVKLVFLDEDLRKALGIKEDTFNLPEGSTIKELLLAAALKYGEKIIEKVSKAGTIIALNGQNIEFLGGTNARLFDGDRVAIIPQIEGG